MVSYANTRCVTARLFSPDSGDGEKYEPPNLAAVPVVEFHKFLPRSGEEFNE